MIFLSGKNRFAFLGLALSLVVLLSFRLAAQISLWTDSNLYSERLAAGKLIEVAISERFEIKVDSNWNKKSTVELKLKPEKEYQNFLKPAELNKSQKDDSEAKYKVNDTINLRLMAIVGQAAADGQSYAITARKTVIVDGKNFQIQLSGFIDASSVKNNRVESSKIAELQLQIVARPPAEKDNTIAMKTKTENNQQIPVAELSDAEKQKYLLEYLREIIGTMNK